MGQLLARRAKQANPEDSSMQPDAASGSIQPPEAQPPEAQPPEAQPPEARLVFRDGA